VVDDESCLRLSGLDEATGLHQVADQTVLPQYHLVVSLADQTFEDNFLGASGFTHA
jgi:hypothetical protein